MQATLSLNSTRRLASQQSISVERVSPSCSLLQQDGSVDSEMLLRGNKSISIVHNGAIYRLQATKLGKLILTK